MSNENHRIPRRRRRREVQPEHIGWHRGDYRNLVQMVRRRAAKQTKRGQLGVLEDAGFFVRWMSDERTLRVAWDHLSEQGGPAAGVDGLRYGGYTEAQIWECLRAYREDIRDGRYEPDAERVVEISKGPGRGTRRLSIPSIHDRVVQRAIVEILQPYLDPLFDKHSFAYRPGRGVVHALAHARCYAEGQRAKTWVIMDLRDAFHRVPASRLLDVVRYYVGSDEVVDLVRRIVGEGSQPALRQGGPLSPLLLNLYLHHHLDAPWRSKATGVPLLRYADDKLLMCRSRDEALQAREQIVNMLRPTGMLVKGDADSDVVALSTRSSATWLGFDFKAKRGVEDLRILIAREAWSNLAANLEQAHREPNSPIRAWDTILGWLADKGPCYRHSDIKAAIGQIADTARALGFDEIPDAQMMKDRWQRAHARWSKLCKRISAATSEKVATSAART